MNIQAADKGISLFSLLLLLVLSFNCEVFRSEVQLHYKRQGAEGAKLCYS